MPTLAHLLAALLALASLTPAATSQPADPAEDQPAPEPTAGPEPQLSPADAARRERARNRLRKNRPNLEREAQTPRDLQPIDDADATAFAELVTELSDPAYEGRSPGSAGIENAATLIERHFQDLGLVPAFEASVLASDGTEVITPNASARQALEVGAETDVATAELTIGQQSLTHGTDFSVLAYSGDADTAAPVTFAGYAIVSGPGAYMGFEPNTRLEGRIVLCLNYEPLNPDGTSQWDAEGFSHHASLTHKASALIRRGAEAVLIVNPPNANHERVGILETVESTRMGRPGLNSKPPKFDAPVAMVTPAVARDIIARSGNDELTLESLIDQANQGPTLVELGQQPVAVNVEMARLPRLTDNIGAILPGVGHLKDDIIVVGAHYDHVGYGQRGSRTGREGELHPGADDNASGTTGMLMVAKHLRDYANELPEAQPRRSVLFLAFTAEEIGLLGSLYYTRNPIAPIENHALMLNLDMIGRLESELLEVGGIDSARGLGTFIEPHLQASALPISRELSVGSGRSDHASFDRSEVPNLFFFTGLHDQYHTPDDTADLIDPEGSVRVINLVTDIAKAAMVEPELPVHRRRERSYEAPKEPTVRVGVLPANSTKGGILVNRVFPDTSASEAGLQPGDRIIRWNDTEIDSVESWRPTLVEHKPGDTVTLVVERDGTETTLTMTLRPIE